MNFNRLQKINDKKILHKKGKRWITLSIGIMAMLGGTFLAKQSSVHADANNNQNKQAQTIKQNSNQRADLVKTNNQSQSQQLHNQNVSNIPKEANSLHAQILNNAIQNVNSNNIHNKKMKLGAGQSVKVSSDVPSSDAVRNRYNYLLNNEDSSDNIFLVKPNITHGIPGTINPTYAQHVIDWVNYVRWIVGIKPVQNSAKLDMLAQYGADDMVESGENKHGLGGMSKRPKDISVSDWKKGIDATNNSNLGMGIEPSAVVGQYIADVLVSDAGHRYALLNPSTKSMGIGVDGLYNNLYVYGPSNNESLNHIYSLPAPNKSPFDIGKGSDMADMSWSLMTNDSDISDSKPQITVHDDTKNKNLSVSDINTSDGNITYNVGYNDMGNTDNAPQPNHTYTITFTGKNIPNGKISYTTTLYESTPQSSGSAKPTSTSTNTMPSSSVPTTPQSSSIPSNNTPQQSSSSNIPVVQSARPTVVSSSSTTPPMQSSNTPVQPSSSTSSTPEPQISQMKPTEQRKSKPAHHESLAQQHKSPSDQEVKREQEINTKGAIEHSDTSSHSNNTPDTDPHTDDADNTDEQPSNDATNADYNKPTTTNSSIKQGSTTGTSQNDQNKLPQTNEQDQFHKELGAILLSIGLSAGAFGKAIDKRRRD